MHNKLFLVFLLRKYLHTTYIYHIYNRRQFIDILKLRQPENVPNAASFITKYVFNKHKTWPKRTYNFYGMLTYLSV